MTYISNKLCPEMSIRHTIFLRIIYKLLPNAFLVTKCTQFHCIAMEIKFSLWLFVYFYITLLLQKHNYISENRNLIYFVTFDSHLLLYSLHIVFSQCFY